METLLSPSSILLYGRVVQDLQLQFENFDHRGPNSIQDPPKRRGANRFLQEQLAHPDATLARIYSFSYEGYYYDLPKPAIFVVHGPGVAADLVLKHDPDKRLARTPAGIDRTGRAEPEQSPSYDLKVWVYDKGDFSLRLDVESGPFEQILLDAALASESLTSAYSGAQARGAQARGAQARGAQARISGAQARIRGSD
jgi:hypothetical protein